MEADVKKDSTPADTRQLSSHDRLTSIVAILIFSLGVLASYIFADAAQTRQERDLVVRETQAITALESYIQARSASYDQALRGASGMVNIVGRQNITNQKWNRFVKNLNANDRLSELLGIGIADSVTPESLAEYESREGITMRPAGTRETYGIIRYIEPYTDKNAAALGFDMFSEATRRTAMIKARDTDESVLSGPLISVQDSMQSSAKKPYSVLMYHPFYSSGYEATSVQNRAATIQGYTYLIFRPSDVLGKIDALEENKYDLSVDDITDSKKSIRLFTSGGYKESSPSRLYRDIQLNGRKWRLNLNVRERQLAVLNSFSLFMMGLGGSVLLTLAAYILMRNRTERVNVRHRNDIQQTKDELLALASHQLRTPATGVSQYLTMIQQGYFGPLNDKQQEIATKAFDANQRQLEIIDQLLYVAKADAGQIMITPSTINVTKLVMNTLEESSQHATRKGIVFKTKVPHHVDCFVDRKYTTMIIENLISNAIKYSHPSSTIHITLKQRIRDDMAHLSIKDTGVGISEDDQAHLFQKFSRINNPLSQSEGGSGLGLYLAKKLATSQGGDIVVRSEEGKGSEFTLLLPLHKRHSENIVDLGA